jgi:hypothetical protein
MVIVDQHLPVGLRLEHPAYFDRMLSNRPGLRRCATEYIGAGIDGISQDVVHSIIHGEPPDNLATLLSKLHRCQDHPFFATPQQRSSWAARILIIPGLLIMRMLRP